MPQMNCYTYLDPIPQLHDEGLIELWAESWKKHGWNPVVLSRADAEKDESFNLVFSQVNKLPTLNPKSYELACYLRWVSLRQVGGGVMTDFDVMNYGFKPDDADICRKPTLYTPNVPCVVSGNKQAFTLASLLMAQTEPEDFKEHCSDMYIVEKHHSLFNVVKDNRRCVQYQDPGWENAVLVHYSSSSCNRPKRDKIIAARNPL